MPKDLFYLSLTFLILVISMFNFTKADNSDSTSLSVELDIPDYLPNADSLAHPQKFFSEQPLRVLGGSSEGLEEDRLSAAILYHSEVNCGRCYWEHVLTGHPTDDRHLAIAGISLSTSFYFA